METLVSGQHEVIHDQNDEVKGKRSAERVHGVHQPGDVARGYLTFFPWKGVCVCVFVCLFGCLFGCLMVFPSFYHGFP